MNDQFEHKLEEALNDDVTIPTSVLKKKNLLLKQLEKVKNKNKHPLIKNIGSNDSGANDCWGKCRSWCVW